MNAQRVFQFHASLLAKADDGLQRALERIQLAQCLLWVKWLSGMATL